jgi:hypothetical protein
MSRPTTRMRECQCHPLPKTRLSATQLLLCNEGVASEKPRYPHVETHSEKDSEVLIPIWVSGGPRVPQSMQTRGLRNRDRGRAGINLVLDWDGLGNPLTIPISRGRLLPQVPQPAMSIIAVATCYLNGPQDSNSRYPGFSTGFRRAIKTYAKRGALL